MRLLSLVVIGLVLGRSASAQGMGMGSGNDRSTQVRRPAVTVANLIGAWTRQGEKEVRLTFRADSTMTASVEFRKGSGVGSGRWHLVGDTLVVSNYVVTVKGKQTPTAFDRRVVALQDNQLTMTRVDNHEHGPKAQVYARVGTATP